MLALGVALAVPATVLLATRRDAVAAIPLGLPTLTVVAIAGLVLICRGGAALARRRRE